MAATLLVAGIVWGGFILSMVLVGISDFAARRADLRVATDEAREHGRKFARTVAPTISTPVPVKRRIVAGGKRDRGPFAA